MRLRDLNSQTIKAFYGTLPTGRVHQIHRVLRRALTVAVDDGLLPRNPASKARKPEKYVPRFRYWTALELERFLASERVLGHRLAALWRLYPMSGLRRGEALGLMWTDIDWQGVSDHE